MAARELSGKVAVLVGGTSGIGKASAIEFASRGATVLIVGRDTQRGNDARVEVISASGERNVEFLKADVSLLSEVRRVAAHVLSHYKRLDYLVLSAGILRMGDEITSEGLSGNVVTNYLGKFLLVHLLLERLKASEAAGIAIVLAPSKQKSPQLNAEYLRGKKSPAMAEAMNQAEFGLDLFVASLAEILKGSSVTARVTNPTIVKETRVLRYLPRPIKFLLGFFGNFIGVTASKAGEVVFQLATDSSLKGTFFKLMEPIEVHPDTYKVALQKALVSLSESLILTSAKVQGGIAS